MTTAVAINRTAEDQTRNGAQKPKVGSRTDAAVKYTAVEDSSSGASKSILQTFLLEHGNAKNEKKPAATDGLKAATKPPSAALKRTAEEKERHQLSARSTKTLRTMSPPRPQSLLSSPFAAGTKRKAEEEHGNASKKCKCEVV